MTYSIGSLFSGYGGLDMGVQMALGRMDLAWVSDIEPGPSAILRHHYPHVPNLGDITTVDWERVEPVDVICGGSPCQDLSVAGRRAGMRPGTRSGLWESMLHAVETIRPHLVVWENVRGALSADAFSLMESREGRVGNQPGRPVLRALGRVLGDLAAIGYDAQWLSVRASDVGAPHHRLRVFVTAHPGRLPGQPWWSLQPGGDGAPEGGGALLGAPGRGDEPVALLPTPTSSDRGGEAARAGAGYGMPLGEAVRLLPTPRASDGDKGGPNQRGSSGDLTMPSAVQAARFGEYASAIARWERATRLAPSPTEPGTRGGQRLSPRFVEWMQGLPDGWVTGAPITRPQQLRALGNGVVPQQAAHAIRLMRERNLRCDTAA